MPPVTIPLSDKARRMLKAVAKYQSKGKREMLRLCLARGIRRAYDALPKEAAPDD